MDNKKYLHSEITNTILQAFYKVYNTLGIGFGEKAYQNAMLVEMKRLGLHSETEKKLPIYYEGEKIDEIQIGILVNEKVLLLLTTQAEPAENEIRKLYKYLQSSIIEVGVIVNFGNEPHHHRRFCGNEKKKLPKADFLDLE